MGCEGIGGCGSEEHMFFGDMKDCVNTCLLSVSTKAVDSTHTDTAEEHLEETIASIFDTVIPDGETTDTLTAMANDIAQVFAPAPTPTPSPAPVDKSVRELITDILP